MIELGLGEQGIKFIFSDFTAVFGETSLIELYDENEKLVLKIDPMDLFSLYGAYQQMIKEEKKDEQ